MYFDLCDNYMYNATWACMIITWVCRGRSDWHSSPVFPLYLAQGSTGKGLWYICFQSFSLIIPHSHYIVFTVSRLYWEKIHDDILVSHHFHSNYNSTFTLYCLHWLKQPAWCVSLTDESDHCESSPWGRLKSDKTKINNNNNNNKHNNNRNTTVKVHSE